MEKEDALEVLQTLLMDVLRVRFEGAPYAKLARAHGYADGYMRALLDTATVDREALIDAVAEARQRFVTSGCSEAIEAPTPSVSSAA